MEEPRGFERARRVAENIAREQEKAQQIVEQTIQKAEAKKQRILEFRDDLYSLIKMVRAYFNKEYTEIPWKTVIFALAAILYFLNPFDVIPDLLPALGFLDDATVIAFGVNAVKEDLEKFKSHQGNSESVE